MRIIHRWYTGLNIYTVNSEFLQFTTESSVSIIHTVLPLRFDRPTEFSMRKDTGPCTLGKGRHRRVRSERNGTDSLTKQEKMLTFRQRDFKKVGNHNQSGEPLYILLRLTRRCTVGNFINTCREYRGLKRQEIRSVKIKDVDKENTHPFTERRSNNMTWLEDAILPKSSTGFVWDNISPVFLSDCKRKVNFTVYTLSWTEGDVCK